MATATELRARRDVLTAQRSSGVARVSYDGKTVDYRSVAEIDRAIEALDREAFRALLERAATGPIAEHTDDANAQHYEVPAQFFHQHLGPRLKYSCCLYPTGEEDLATAEEAMLALYAERAGVADGQRILDLGCGWGSLSLWMARAYPNAKITALVCSGRRRPKCRRPMGKRPACRPPVNRRLRRSPLTPEPR